MSTLITSSKNTFQQERRPVGRPKSSHNVKKTNKRLGIVHEPKYNDNVIELCYDVPINFKKIFNLFKLMIVREIKIEFCPHEVKISGIGHLQKNFINLTIDGNKLTQYFCKHNIVIVVDLKNIDKVIQKIDKSYDSIYIIAKSDSYRKNINIVLNDEKQGTREYHTISLIEEITTDIDDIFNELNFHSYPLTFTLPSKYFKKIINDISKFNNEFTIERKKGIILSFPYDTNSKNVDVNHIFLNEKIFKIKSTLSEDDLLSTTVNIEYIHSLATSLISDAVEVFVDKEKMMVFRCVIDDGTFELLICVDIINYR